MKKILILILSTIVLFSCSPKDEVIEVGYEISNETLMQDYEIPDRSLNLGNKNIKGFVNLSLYLTGTEVNNIYLQDNRIEFIDVSNHKKLGRLDISNNMLRFGTDLKVPSDIRHLNLSNNELSNLDGITGLQKLKSLDLSNNKLDNDDIKDLMKSKTILYLNLEGNINIDQEMIDRMTKFNQKYLTDHKMPYIK